MVLEQSWDLLFCFLLCCLMFCFSPYFPLCLFLVWTKPFCSQKYFSFTIFLFFVYCLYIYYVCINQRAEWYAFCLSIQCYANDVIIMYANDDVTGKTLKKICISGLDSKSWAPGIKVSQSQTAVVAWSCTLGFN